MPQLSQINSSNKHNSSSHAKENDAEGLQRQIHDPLCQLAALDAAPLCLPEVKRANVQYGEVDAMMKAGLRQYS